MVAIVLASSMVAYAQTCKDTIKATTPDSRFTLLNGGSEVKDNKTGLIWQRCSLGQTWNGSTCTGTANTYPWQNALKAAKAVGNGYRLPNIKELTSIVELKCYAPAINLHTFPNTPSDRYWSSSPHAYGNYSAWGVYFLYGYDYNHGKGYQGAVRAVRSE